MEKLNSINIWCLFSICCLWPFVCPNLPKVLVFQGSHGTSPASWIQVHNFLFILMVQLDVCIPVAAQRLQAEQWLFCSLKDVAGNSRVSAVAGFGFVPPGPYPGWENTFFYPVAFWAIEMSIWRMLKSVLLSTAGNTCCYAQPLDHGGCSTQVRCLKLPESQQGVSPICSIILGLLGPAGRREDLTRFPAWFSSSLLWLLFFLNYYLFIITLMVTMVLCAWSGRVSIWTIPGKSRVVLLYSGRERYFFLDSCRKGEWSEAASYDGLRNWQWGWTCHAP